MKILRTTLFLLLCNIYSYANTHSLAFDNDAFITTQDGQYTGGTFYTFMDDQTENKSFALSYTHLYFTPEESNSTEPILDDTPYAGYIFLNFLYYKHTNDYFHEFAITLDAVGPQTKSEQIQNNFHKIIGAHQQKGWNNQLKNEYGLGLSYNYATKTYKTDIYGLKYDWTNNVRFDVGKFYSGAMLGTVFRIGNRYYDNFSTTGNFIGGYESELLNFKQFKNFNWAISFGFFANKVENFHLLDEAARLGYSTPRVGYMTGEYVSYDIYYKKIQYSFKIKSIYLHNNKLLSTAKKQWGTFGLIWKF